MPIPLNFCDPEFPVSQTKTEDHSERPVAVSDVLSQARSIIYLYHDMFSPRNTWKNTYFVHI